MAKHYDKQFKLDAIRYYHDHRELGLQGCASNLGISHQTLSRWQKELRDTGDIENRGSGNYASDEAKEIARLKRELRDAQDALDVLKKAINILEKRRKPFTSKLLRRQKQPTRLNAVFLSPEC
jgi:transposase